jgi:hypothetical protein
MFTTTGMELTHSAIQPNLSGRGVSRTIATPDICAADSSEWISALPGRKRQFAGTLSGSHIAALRASRVSA